MPLWSFLNCNMAKAIWHTDAKTTVLLEEADNLLSDLVEVKALYSAVSSGTERLVACGAISEELTEKMKVPYMKGSFSFPIQYGYSISGVTPDMKPVHLMHPHQNHLWVKEDDLFYYTKSICPKLATQFSNMETVVNALWDSGVQSNNRVLVCGTGSVGILLAQTLKEYVKAEVYVLEKNPEKRERLVQLGFQLCDGKSNYEICFNVSGSGNGLQYCIDHCETEGTVVELSWYGTQKIELQLGGNFHYNRVRIISSQVSKIPKSQPQFDFYSRKKWVETLLTEVDYSAFLTQIIPFESAPAFFNRLRQNQEQNEFITLIEY